MGDSTAMTIEFLRARLLSERAVSRAAKERAEQLDKRVAELEEQIRIVTLQRKKAERAAHGALSILEAHGINYLSEIVDSSSDKDECPHNGESFKEEEVSAASKFERIEIDDTLSSSEPGGSPSQAGSISWKSQIDGPNFQKKLKAKQFRQRQRQISLIACTESTPKYKLGKSCRQIKSKEVGSAPKDEGDNHANFDADGQREARKTDSVDDQPDCSMEASGSESCSLDAENKDASSGCYALGTEGNEEMERVLEQQAQLIGQYEAEEEAQREWEENYNETKSSNLDFLDLENKCHAAENMQTRKQTNVILDIVLYEEKEAESNAGTSSEAEGYTSRSLSDVPVLKLSDGTSREMSGGGWDATTRAFSNGITTTNLARTMNNENTNHACRGGSWSQLQNVAANAFEQGHPQFAVSPKASILSGPVAKQTPDVVYESSESGSSDISSHKHGHLQLSSPANSNPATADSRSDKSKLRPSMAQGKHRMTCKTTGGNLGDVLEALQRAKMSLKLEFQKPHLPDQNRLALVPATDYHVRTITSGDILNIPLSSDSLFRLPTDYIPPSGSSEPNIHTSWSRSGNISPIEYGTSAKYNLQPCRDSGFDIPMEKKYYNTCNSATGLSVSNRDSLPLSDLANSIAPFSSAFGVPVLCNQNLPGYSPVTETQPSSKYSLPSDMIMERKLLADRSENSVFQQYPEGSIPKRYPDANLIGMGVPSFNKYSIPYPELASDRMLLGHGISNPDRRISQDGILRNEKTFI